MRKLYPILVIGLLFVSCGARRKEAKKEALKAQIEARVVELTCECLEPYNDGTLSKKEYEDKRDECLRGTFPTLSKEFDLSEENNPYGGMIGFMSAFERIKDGLKEKCPRKEN